MRVLLKLRLECRPDAAWRALQSPTVMRECAGPWLDYASLEPAGFPPRWDAGSHPVTLLAAGFAPIGGQRIQISLDTTRHEDVRIVHDDGGALTGFPKLITRWDHRMAVSPHPDDPNATLYRDRLVFEAGALTVALWPSLWALWQWRGLRLQQLAPSFDELPATAPAVPEPTDTAGIAPTPSETAPNQDGARPNQDSAAPNQDGEPTERA